MKTKHNKCKYLNVIQQNTGNGWDDVSEYECDSKGVWNKERVLITVISKNTGLPIQRSVSLLSQDLKEYLFTGYATRVIFRKELNELWEANKNGYSDIDTFKTCQICSPLLKL